MGLLEAGLWSGFGFLYLALALRIMTIALKAVDSERRPLWILASCPFLAPVFVPLSMLVTSAQGPMNYLGMLAGAVVGVPLGWLAGSAFRALPTKPVHYFARHRGRRQYRHLRGPEPDPKPPGINPFIENESSPPGGEDPNNPFKDLKLSDDAPGEQRPTP